MERHHAHLGEPVEPLGDPLLADCARCPDLGAAARAIVDREHRRNPAPEPGAEGRLHGRGVVGDARLVSGAPLLVLATRRRARNPEIECGRASDARAVSASGSVPQSRCRTRFDAPWYTARVPGDRNSPHRSHVPGYRRTNTLSSLTDPPIPVVTDHATLARS